MNNNFIYPSNSRVVYDKKDLEQSIKTSLSPSNYFSNNYISSQTECIPTSSQFQPPNYGTPADKIDIQSNLIFGIPLTEEQKKVEEKLNLCDNFVGTISSRDKGFSRDLIETHSFPLSNGSCFETKRLKNTEALGINTRNKKFLKY